MKRVNINVTMHVRSMYQQKFTVKKLVDCQNNEPHLHKSFFQYNKLYTTITIYCYC